MTTEPRIEKLENELICAERRNGRLLAGVFLLVAFLALMWSGADKLSPAYAQNTAPKVIRANEFILEDENGKTRAVLGMSNGAPVLSLVDENGELLAMLAVSKDGPMLSLCDENGKIRAGLSVSKDGPALGLYDKNGKTRAKLVESVLGLIDENENPRAMLRVSNGGSGLGLYDEKGKTRAGLTVLKDGPQLFLSDENGNMIWQAPINK